MKKTYMTLDLRKGTRVRISSGAFEGRQGSIVCPVYHQRSLAGSHGYKVMLDDAEEVVVAPHQVKSLG